MPTRKTAAPRRRLESAAAREMILDATEKRLIVSGPSGIRLQEVAADAGVSHPTVLHHFGSRELLVQAVIARSLRAIHAALVEAITASAGDEGQVEAVIQNVATALRDTGHGRVIMWLSLEGHAIDDSELGLRDVIDATHALRVARRGKDKKVTREDTARIVVLAALALVAGSVIGPKLMENAGLGADAQTGVRFRKWLVRLLMDHLDR